MSVFVGIAGTFRYSNVVCQKRRLIKIELRTLFTGQFYIIYLGDF